MQQDPLNRRTTYQYDSAGQLTVRIDGKSRRTTLTYDAAGQLESREYQDGTRVTTTFDGAGLRTVLWDSTGRYTSTYDAASRLETVKNPAGKVITYGYELDNQRSFTQEPGGGRFTYTYDEAGRIKSVENPQSDRTTYAYDSAGRRTTIQRANGTSSTYTYDAASQVTGLTHLSSTGLYLARYTYTYDNAGNPTKVNEIGATVTWGYDNANQLTSEVRDSAGVVQYADTMTYDAVGNRATLFDVTAPEPRTRTTTPTSCRRASKGRHARRSPTMPTATWRWSTWARPGPRTPGTMRTG